MNDDMVKIHLVADRGVVSRQDLVARDLAPNQLSRLVRQGLLTRVVRAFHASPDAPASARHTLAEATRPHHPDRTPLQLPARPYRPDFLAAVVPPRATVGLNPQR